LQDWPSKAQETLPTATAMDAQAVTAWVPARIQNSNGGKNLTRQPNRALAWPGSV
jgi:hypothetical protein